MKYYVGTMIPVVSQWYICGFITNSIIKLFWLLGMTLVTTHSFITIVVFVYDSCAWSFLPSHTLWCQDPDPDRSPVYPSRSSVLSHTPPSGDRHPVITSPKKMLKLPGTPPATRKILQATSFQLVATDLLRLECESITVAHRLLLLLSFKTSPHLLHLSNNDTSC